MHGSDIVRDLTFRSNNFFCYVAWIFLLQEVKGKK